MAFTEPAAPNSQIPPKVSSKIVEGAVNSLLRWWKSQLLSQKPKLSGADDEFVYLILTLKKTPSKGSVNPYNILLPHSLTSEFSKSCLIIDDRAKSRVTKEAVQKKIQAEGIPISNVLKLSKLKSDYRSHEAKRKLCNSYNMFFADSRVIPLLPRILGRKFFGKKRIPLGLDLTQKNWKEQIEKSSRSALIFLTTGTCSVIKVASASMEKHEIVENVVAAIVGVAEVVPRKWKNVRSFHLKLLESVSLPIYQSFPDHTLNIAGSNLKQDNLDEEEGEEASGGKVKEGKKLSKKKGRIHEVRYMDNTVDGEFDEDNLEDVDVKEEEDGEDSGGMDVMVKKTKRIKFEGGLKRRKSAKDE